MVPGGYEKAPGPSCEGRGLGRRRLFERGLHRRYGGGDLLDLSLRRNVTVGRLPPQYKQSSNKSKQNKTVDKSDKVWRVRGKEFTHALSIAVVVS